MPESPTNPPEAAASEVTVSEVAPPDAAALDGLAGTRFGPVRWFAEIDSTNRWLLDHARAGMPAGLVAVADAQSAGRGRLGRTWTAPVGGSLLVSVLLRPSLPIEQWHLITTTAGLAAAEAVTRLTHDQVAPRLKWPNDLVLPTGKLAGLLAESAGGALVVGMGLNVAWPAVPDELDGIATAISLAGATNVPSRTTLLVTWLRRWHGWLEILDAPDGAGRVQRAAQRASATIGSRVEVHLADERFTGTAVAIDPAGHLVVAPDAAPAGRGSSPAIPGPTRTVSAGDVVHLRPTAGEP